MIIGLIVGGVLVGQDLIAGAQRRKLFSKLTEIETAFSTFRLKYNCLPGDCPNATQFFGKNALICNADSGSAGSPGTCNGNGSRIITSENYEDSEAINQLALAKFIPYPPASGESPVIDPAINSNIMLTLSGVITVPITGGTYYFGETYAESIPLKNCANLQFLDIKYDDGVPTRGKFLVIEEEANQSVADYCTDSALNSYINTGELPFAGAHFLLFRMH